MDNTAANAYAIEPRQSPVKGIRTDTPNCAAKGIKISGSILVGFQFFTLGQICLEYEMYVQSSESYTYNGCSTEKNRYKNKNNDIANKAITMLLLQLCFPFIITSTLYFVLHSPWYKLGNSPSCKRLYCNTAFHDTSQHLSCYSVDIR